MEIYFGGKIDSCSAGLGPATLRSLAHDYPTVPSPRLMYLMGETVIPQTDVPIITVITYLPKCYENQTYNSVHKLGRSDV